MLKTPIFLLSWRNGEMIFPISHTKVSPSLPPATMDTQVKQV